MTGMTRPSSAARRRTLLALGVLVALALTACGGGGGGGGTGGELLVWGGRDIVSGLDLADGAAYDPATDRWRMLPPAGLSARSMRDGMAWTGKEVVLWGGGTSNEAFDDGAAYDPAA